MKKRKFETIKCPCTLWDLYQWLLHNPAWPGENNCDELDKLLLEAILRSKMRETAWVLRTPALELPHLRALSILFRKASKNHEDWLLGMVMTLELFSAMGGSYDVASTIGGFLVDFENLTFQSGASSAAKAVVPKEKKRGKRRR